MSLGPAYPIFYKWDKCFFSVDAAADFDTEGKMNILRDVVQEIGFSREFAESIKPFAGEIPDPDFMAPNKKDIQIGCVPVQMWVDVFKRASVPGCFFVRTTTNMAFIFDGEVVSHTEIIGKNIYRWEGGEIVEITPCEDFPSTCCLENPHAAARVKLVDHNCQTHQLKVVTQRAAREEVFGFN